ncbi:MAG: phosphate uptake regulator, PhoU [Nitrososphaerota archaeon]|jgi:phosphate transport system protein|nr:phosphate uptake regulator, PhoU [Nitrososphaerota archaeon]
MARLIEIALDRLASMLMDMANLAEKAVNTSIEAYSEGNNEVQEIHSWSEELRALQDDVSELAVDIIARFQPVGSDLRFLRAAMEIAYGFSRFGRYAYDIAEVLEMWGDISRCDHTTVEITAKTTREMIRMSIEAFANRDVELAKNVKTLDDFVDDKYREHVDKIVHGQEKDLTCAMSAALILRYLERISDHSSYIGDSVVYIVTGEKAPRK